MEDELALLNRPQYALSSSPNGTAELVKVSVDSHRLRRPTIHANAHQALAALGRIPTVKYPLSIWRELCQDMVAGRLHQWLRFALIDVLPVEIVLPIPARLKNDRPAILRPGMRIFGGVGEGELPDVEQAKTLTGRWKIRDVNIGLICGQNGNHLFAVIRSGDARKLHVSAVRELPWPPAKLARAGIGSQLPELGSEVECG